MNLKDKLKNIPKIYYINLDERDDRKDFMESQFDTWKITNYERYSASKYTLNNVKDWINQVNYSKNINLNNIKKTDAVLVAQTMTYIDIIEHWLRTTNDQYMIIFEDDYDLSMIEYWHFDWDFFMNNIPYDWDAIQLSYENPVMYPCYLHPTLNVHGIGGILINRYYAEKIMRLHKIEGKYCLNRDINNISTYYWGDRGDKSEKHNPCPILNIDYIISKNGRCYSIPLIYQVSNMGQHMMKDVIKDLNKQIFKCCEDACRHWWINLRDEYTLKDFFQYGKPNDKVIKFKWTNEVMSVIL